MVFAGMLLLSAQNTQKSNDKPRMFRRNDRTAAAPPAHQRPADPLSGRIAALQRWKKNMLLSMFAGTALYMLLMQMVF